MADVTVTGVMHVDKYSIWSSYDLDDQTVPMASAIGVPAVFPPTLLFKNYHYGKMSFGGCMIILEV